MTETDRLARKIAEELDRIQRTCKKCGNVFTEGGCRPDRCYYNHVKHIGPD